MLVARFAFVALVLAAGAGLAADASVPHEHRGRLKPYPSSPPHCA
jgi:hypothetical protein